jgi:hypothetical protein
MLLKGASEGGEIEFRPRGSLALAEARELLAVDLRPAAYEPDGSVARDTLRLQGRDGNWADSHYVPRSLDREVVMTCAEEVVWGGAFVPNYGHFLTETVGRLWPLLPNGQLTGLPVVLMVPDRSHRLWHSFEWLDIALEWLGAYGVQIAELPKSGAIRFTKMLVPEPAWRLNGWIAPEIRDIHLQARRGLELPSTPERDFLWLSRSALADHRRAYDECMLEWLLAPHVTVVTPEAMSLGTQISLLDGARAIAGVVGSAFHTLLMVKDHPQCLYLCPAWDKPAYAAQDMLLNANGTFANSLTFVMEPKRKATVRFPAGYRLQIPETLQAIDATVRPTLLDNTRLAAFAELDVEGARGNPFPNDTIDAAAARAILEPLSSEARRALGMMFRNNGLPQEAAEQFQLAADLDSQ